MENEIIFIKGINSLKEVKKEIKKHGNFFLSLKGWQKIEIEGNKLYVTKNKKIVVYNLVHGTFGFPVRV